MDFLAIGTILDRVIQENNQNLLKVIAIDFNVKLLVLPFRVQIKSEIRIEHNEVIEDLARSGINFGHFILIIDFSMICPWQV